MEKIKKNCELCGNAFELEADCFESLKEMQEVVYCSLYCFEESELYN